MSKEYQVISRREVPVKTAGTGLFTGRKFEEVPNHAGKKAVFVQRADGYRAWGFGGSWTEAETVAASNAAALAA